MIALLNGRVPPQNQSSSELMVRGSHLWMAGILLGNIPADQRRHEEPT